MIEAVWVLVAGVMFLATFVRSAFGFGEALVAVPLLALLVPVEVVVPLCVFVSLTVAVIVLAQDRRDVQVRSAGRLFIATLAGMPLGVWLLVSAPGEAIKAALGALIVLFSLYSLFARRVARLHDDRYAGAFGFGAGVLGGAYGMSGPPLVVYGALRGWSPRHFRATLQGYFLPANAVTLVGFWFAGLLTEAVRDYYLIGLPGVLLGVAAGRALNRRLNAPAFLLYVHIGLIAAGIALLVQALT